MTFALLPEIYVKNDKSSEFYGEISKMIEYSKNEKVNNAYYWFKKEGNNSDWFGFELYGSRSECYDQHMQSQEFQNFLKVTADKGLFTKAPALKNYEPVLGFASRETTYPKDTLVLLATLSCKSAETREKWLSEMKRVADYVEAVSKHHAWDSVLTRKEEKTTYSYLAMKSLDNDTYVLNYE